MENYLICEAHGEGCNAYQDRLYQLCKRLDLLRAQIGSNEHLEAAFKIASDVWAEKACEEEAEILRRLKKEGA